MLDQQWATVWETHPSFSQRYTSTHVYLRPLCHVIWNCWSYAVSPDSFLCGWLSPADVEPMSIWCWSGVYDAGPTSNQHQFNGLCFLVWLSTPGTLFPIMYVGKGYYWRHLSQFISIYACTHTSPVTSVSAYRIPSYKLRYIVGFWLYENMVLLCSAPLAR